MNSTPAKHTTRERPAGAPAARGSRSRTPLAACLAASLLASCATYADRTRDAFHDFQSGHLDRALEAFGDTDTTGSPFLSGAEAGTAALTAGRWDEALEHLHAAEEDLERIDDRAVIGPANFSESLGSWVLNDSKKAYRGEGFERVFLHCGLALAYLAMGRLEDVYVEARRSNKLLENEEELYDREYGAGGLGHFLSAVAYELLGEPGEAYIDYERMVEKGVGVELAGKALVRLSAQLGREEDLSRWEQRFGPDYARAGDAASIVVIAGVGLGPYKREIKAAFPTEDGLLNLAVPDYVRRPQPVPAVRLVLPGQGIAVRTSVLEDVMRVASENLEDRLALTAVKSAARGVAKRQLTRTLQDEYGGIGRLVGDVFSFATERADLRCWTTLPDSWQAARLFVAPGRHRLQLEAVGGDRVPLGTFELEPGETLFVFARTIHRRVHAHTVGGLRVVDTEGRP